MMFRHLGMFALLAVCLFAIAIVMGGCGGGDTDDDDDDEWVINPPPSPPTAEDLFWQQLKEGESDWDWEVREFKGKPLEKHAQDLVSKYAHWRGIKPTYDSSNRVWFQRGWSFELEWKIWIVRSDLPRRAAGRFEQSRNVFTIRGTCSIKEVSGSSATMTLSLKRVDRGPWNWGDDRIPIEWIEELVLGEVVVDERVSINGDQLRIGQMLLERAN